jgi:branched-chain amino acid transport system substrate-binding protein
VVGLSGCGTDPVLGVLLPRSGDNSTYGESIESGVRVALAEERERGTLPSGLEVLWADTESDPATAAEQFRQLARDGASLIVGGATSGEARELLPVMDSLRVNCISPSASAPDLAMKSRYFFRIFPSDQLEGNQAGKFMHDQLSRSAEGADPTTIIYTTDSEYSRGIEPEFRQQFEENLGGEVVARISLTDAQWMERSRESLDQHRPQGAYVIGYADEILQVLEHLNQEGYQGVITTTSAIYAAEAIATANELTENLFFPLAPFDRTAKTPVVERFVDRYTDSYQRAPDIFAAHGYDAARVAFQALRVAKRFDSTEIGKALRFGVKEFDGVTGRIRFDDFGDVKHYPLMFILKDGQVLSYKRYLKREQQRILRDMQNLLDEGSGS